MVLEIGVAGESHLRLPDLRGRIAGNLLATPEQRMTATLRHWRLELDPIPLALERVSGQGHFAVVIWGIETLPVHFRSPHVQLAQTLQNLSPISTTAPQRCQPQPLVTRAETLSPQPRQRRPR